jgi:hypothetical protein
MRRGNALVLGDVVPYAIGSTRIRPGEVLGDRILLGSIARITKGRLILSEGLDFTMMLLMAPASLLHESFDECSLTWSYTVLDKFIDALNSWLVKTKGHSFDDNRHIHALLLPI